MDLAQRRVRNTSLELAAVMITKTHLALVLASLSRIILFVSIFLTNDRGVFFPARNCLLRTFCVTSLCQMMTGKLWLFATLILLAHIIQELLVKIPKEFPII